MRLAWPLREFRFLTDLVATLMIFNHVKGYICRSWADVTSGGI
jgi:hypothetical protein